MIMCVSLQDLPPNIYIHIIKLIFQQKGHSTWQPILKLHAHLFSNIMIYQNTQSQFKNWEESKEKKKKERKGKKVLNVTMSE